MLRLIIGPDSRARRRALYGRIADAGEGALLIVPRQFSFESEKLLGAFLGGERRSLAEVLSFPKLCERIFHRYGGFAGDHIDDTGRLLLMSAALSETGSDLRFFTKSAKDAAFAEELVRADGELRKSGVSGADLEQIAEDCAGSVLGEKAADLSKILSVYRAMVSAGYADELDELPRVAAMLETKAFFKDKKIFFDSFNRFSAVESRLVLLMLEAAPEVTVSLCCDTVFDRLGGVGPFAVCQKTAARLHRAAEDAGVKTYVEDAGFSPEGIAPALRHLAEYFLKPAAVPFSGDFSGAVELYQAANPYEEASFVAASVRELAERGCRYRDICVIGRDLSPYEHPLADAFGKAGIPYFLDRRDDAADLPPTAFALAALECCTRNFEAAPVLRMMKTGLLPFSEEDVAEFENYCEIWSVRGRLFLQPFTASPSGFDPPAEGDAALLERLEAMRRQVMEPLEALRNGLDRCDGRRFCDEFFRFFEACGVPDGLRRLCETYEAAGNLRLAAELPTLWDSLVALLDRFYAGLGGVSLGPAKMAKLFTMSVTAADLGVVPQTADSVTIGTADRLRPVDSKAVFLIGLNDRVFPAPVGSGGLFSSSEKKQLAEIGFELSDTEEDLLAEERSYAFTAFTAPSEKLIVCRSRWDVKGDELGESPFLARLSSLFPGLKSKTAADYGKPFFLRTERGAFDALTEAGGESGYASALREFLSARPEWREKCERLKSGVDPSRFAITEPGLADALFGKKLRLSASKIEAYESCPFSFFVQNGLRLRERRKAELSPLDTGTLIHYILQVMLQTYGGRGLAELSEKERRAAVLKLLEEYLSGVLGGEENKSGRFLYLYSRLAGHLARLFERIAEEFRQSEFEPAGFEVPVSEEEGVEPLRLRTPDGRDVLVEGRIDRVDVLEKNGKRYARVVDYKSGAKAFDLSDVYYGLNMQMLIYLFSIWQDGRSEFAGHTPAGVLYMPARDASPAAERGAAADPRSETAAARFRMNGLLLDDLSVLNAMEPGLAGIYIPVKMRNNGCDTANLATLEQFGAIERHIASVLVSMAQELGAGRIEALPVARNDKKQCERCRFLSVCRMPEDGPCSKLGRLTKQEFFDGIEGGEGV
ncbi:MAG TPA: PD-(D/E)XK nuclease family protein [Oscillospiraceae bacterium]|nr:PD-(D/E)XK nuclease family protein [Oscillospiraceae bacterium]HNW04916.1 PD-(D/E)XK nuclease family protein [Oscillospiraceae bacterium]